MRIAFSADKGDLDSNISQHFGKANYYVFVDIENNKITNVFSEKNPFLIDHKPGVSPKFIAKHNADMLIAGNIGQNAQNVFKALNIEFKIMPVDSIRNIIKKLFNAE